MERLAYTRREAAELCSVSVGTFKNWEKRGLVSTRKIGRKVLVPRDEILALLKLREVDTDAARHNRA